MLKAKKMLFLNDVEKKDYKRIEKKVRNRNVATIYQVASIFNFTELYKLSLCYIERCFPVVCEKYNFKMLSFARIAKIVSSSELNIDSEMEVIKAIDSWINYDFEERSKFASRLLSKVRLELLSVDALNSVLDSDMSFSKIDDCVAMLRNALKNNETSDRNMSSRFCSQHMFNVFLSGGFINQPTFRLTGCPKLLSAENLNQVKDIARMNIKRVVNHKSVYCKGAVYVFGGYDENCQVVKSVEKYSFVTKKWENICEMSDDRRDFCACAFMDRIYIIGGTTNAWNPFYSCMKLSTKDNKWYEVAGINHARISSASTVYEGRIVVSGGINNNDIINNFNTVQAYDPFGDTWSSMPNMIEGRCNQGSVAMRNKLFVFGSLQGNGSNSCEVFDSTCKKFVMLKQLPSTLKFNFGFAADTFAIGNKLITISYYSPTALYYDVENDEWSDETFNLTKDNYVFRGTILPQIKF